jgi:hypothetical protein
MRVLVLILGLLATIPVGCASAPPAPAEEEAPQTVRALRYKVFFLQDARSWSGQWGYELYFPEQEVVCNVIFEFPDFEEADNGLKPRLNAFRSGIRNRYLVEPHGAEVVAETEEVEIPADLAREIFELADLTRRQEEESFRIGRKQFELGGFPVVDPYLLEYEKTIREIEEKKGASTGGRLEKPVR